MTPEMESKMTKPQQEIKYIRNIPAPYLQNSMLIISPCITAPPAVQSAVTATPLSRKRMPRFHPEVISDKADSTIPTNTSARHRYCLPVSFSFRNRRAPKIVSAQ